MVAQAVVPVAYQYGEASRDGIGKFYLGREISHVMGHQGAAWLERPGRDREEATQVLVSELGLQADQVRLLLSACFPGFDNLSV